MPEAALLEVRDLGVEVAGRSVLDSVSFDIGATLAVTSPIGFILALNPVLRIRTQLSEILRAHITNRALTALLTLTGLADAGRILRSYPHQLSGGERQRVTLAQAVACYARHAKTKQEEKRWFWASPTLCPADRRRDAGGGWALPDAKVSLGEHANHEVLQERGATARFIHTAAHGEFRQDNPMFSSIGWVPRI